MEDRFALFAKKFDLVFLFAFFSLLLIFHLAEAITSHFLTASIKYSCCSFSEIRLLSFASSALALSLLSMLVWMLWFNFILGAFTICMENPEIPGRIQMERLIPAEIK